MAKSFKFQLRFPFAKSTSIRAVTIAGRKLFAEGVNGVVHHTPESGLTPIYSAVFAALLERYIGVTLADIEKMDDAEFERVFGFRAPADDADTDG